MVRLVIAALASLVLAGVAPPPVEAQTEQVAGRPIREVRFEGLRDVDPQLVRNAVRSEAGEPLDPQTVRGDVVRLTHLNVFDRVEPRFDLEPDGSVTLVFELSELPLLRDVQVVGNKAKDDGELLAAARLRRGDPSDPFLIRQAEEAIEQAYESAGYFLADVEADTATLERTGILVLRVREGPRTRIRRIDFRGNESIADREIRARIRSETHLPVFRSGSLSRVELNLDVARIRRLYRDRGYLDVRVGRRIDLSDDQRDARVVFLIEEGPLYRVESIRFEGNRLFSSEQLRETITLARGGVFSQGDLDQSMEQIRSLYGRLGYISADVAARRLFAEGLPRVNLVVEIDEGIASEVGRISVQGNAITRDKVALREVRGMRPGRRFDSEGIDRTRSRLRNAPAFSDAQISILGDEDDPIRDVVIETSPAQTGSFRIGASLSSDSGVVGAIDLEQRNFDVADTPNTLGEALSGRAFRGAGQFLRVTIQPGVEFSRFSFRFREPAFFESDLFFETAAAFFQRDRDDYVEERLGGELRLGRRFGDVWSASIGADAQRIDVGEIEDEAPLAIFDVEGDNLLTLVDVSLTRDTTDSPVFPATGSLLSLGVSRAGALGGDFDFTRASLRWQGFWTLNEDFLGRETVLSLNGRVGYIFEDGEAPTFERLFAGGHRTFRGFELRGVGPRGIRADTGERSDEAVGGRWLLLMGAQVNFPLFQEIIRGVVFTDSGTLQEDFGLEDYRVSVGGGFRVRVPFLGSAPFALDFALPLLSEDSDEEQIISFDLALPLQ